MPEPIFRSRIPSVATNTRLRIPQVEGFLQLQEHYADGIADREVGVVLPVGCGKSGLITLTPFALGSSRALVVAPGVKIAQQLHDDFDPTVPHMFYLKCNVLDGGPFPEPVLIRPDSINRGDLEEADVVVTNIHQLQGTNNRWLNDLPADFFDLILFDEAHHNVADSWERLRTAFPQARIVNFSATPVRSDGQQMAGRIIYSFPIFRAIQEGYVKRLKALVLNPTSLRYVRREDGEEIEVTLEEVRRLGEEDASFRRSIVTSQETLTTIVDASIRELDRIRQATGENRHKIIAAALNYTHCIQIVEAYRARGKRADYIHSNETSIVNDRILEKLSSHQLDVIVQVRKLGEGFDHPFLSVAAVFAVFNELSPFVQFVGRIMRVIEQGAPDHPNNQGTVVFHAGSNIARRWTDFQQFSEADQEFFAQLLPMEDLVFGDAAELAIEPHPPDTVEGPIEWLAGPDGMEVVSQQRVLVEELPLLAVDEEALRAFELLLERGFTPEDFMQAYEHRPVPTTRVRERQAARQALDPRIKTEVGRMLQSRDINPQGRDLDTNRLGRSNFVFVKSVLDRRINSVVGRGTGQRGELTRTELDLISARFAEIVAAVEGEVFNGTP